MDRKVGGKILEWSRKMGKALEENRKVSGVWGNKVLVGDRKACVCGGMSTFKTDK